MTTNKTLETYAEKAVTSIARLRLALGIDPAPMPTGGYVRLPDSQPAKACFVPESAKDQTDATPFVVVSPPDPYMIAAKYTYVTPKPLTLDQWHDFCAQARMLMGWQIVSHSSSEGWRLVPPGGHTSGHHFATTQEAWCWLGDINTEYDDPTIGEAVEQYLVDQKIEFHLGYAPSWRPDLPYEAHVGGRGFAVKWSNDQEAALVLAFIEYKEAEAYREAYREAQTK